jgi:transposase
MPESTYRWKFSSLCVVEATGRVVREAKIASEPEALTAWLKNLRLEIVRIGLEAGPLSQWLYAGMKQAGLPAELLETRHVRTAFKIMPVKTDRKDARGIAQLMRLGWFRPVHCKSLAAQETRAVLGARKLLQIKLHDIELSLRGTLRGFGLKVGKTTPKTFEGRVRSLVPPVIDFAADLRIDSSATTEMLPDRETNCREKVCGEAQRRGAGAAQHADPCGQAPGPAIDPSPHSVEGGQF